MPDSLREVVNQQYEGAKRNHERVRELYSGPFFQDSKLRWYPAEKGAGNDGSKAKEFYG